MKSKLCMLVFAYIINATSSLAQMNSKHIYDGLYYAKRGYDCFDLPNYDMEVCEGASSAFTTRACHMEASLRAENVCYGLVSAMVKRHCSNLENSLQFQVCHGALNHYSHRSCHLIQEPFARATCTSLGS